MTNSKTSVGLNVGTLAALLVALVAGIFIAGDMYGIVKKIDLQNKANGDAVNQTLSQLLTLQEANNMRGNDSLILFKALINTQLEQGNKSLANQAEIFKALNITRD
jgi:hypothetical protein